MYQNIPSHSLGSFFLIVLAHRDCSWMWILIVVIVPISFHIVGCFFMHAWPIPTYTEIINSLRTALFLLCLITLSIFLVRYIQPKYIDLLLGGDITTAWQHRKSIGLRIFLTHYCDLHNQREGTECDVMERVRKWGQACSSKGFRFSLLRSWEKKFQSPHS